MEKEARKNFSFRTLARVAGLLGAASVTALYLILLFSNPYSTQGLGGDTVLVIAAMILLALLAAWAALKQNPLVMIAVFLASFFPVGLYLLGTPGIFRWIGVLDLLYLLSAILMFTSRRNSRSLPASGEHLS